VIYPSASFVRSYEPTTLVLEGGDEVHGIVRQETDSEWVIATGPGAEQRLAKATVKEVRPGTVSLMPGGFDQVLSRQELADLLHFVKTVRWR
jgi:putative heme-binding domain-containing protein